MKLGPVDGPMGMSRGGLVLKGLPLDSSGASAKVGPKPMADDATRSSNESAEGWEDDDDEVAGPYMSKADIGKEGDGRRASKGDLALCSWL